eukprot:CAMPEP_0113493290 /NCGR_PEP_ID=MMETSP0014_2-20120614/28516_1 /TAXON_ID=2857 /ORGANISM="Nitzschia sp." /LENGTH=516 /DNA_ID=CAMNT_0000387149 /DNA_START=753 /DNA_END=2303 /DNA_ORIENTATION=+ /assembly_acc=CAM_ASM_000159
MTTATGITTGILLLARLFAGVSAQYSSSSSYGSVYGSNYYADSEQTYYDGYAQAWRYLGWYVDCNGGSSRYYDRSQHSHQSGDGNSNKIGNNYCQRYLMWAAYVDEDYSGGGIGEYAIFDTANGYYDSTACNTNGNGNCKLMDCHDPSSTNWKLLGVYKEASFFGGDAFFEQLFKHEGVCLWNDDDIYEFMSEQRESGFSSGCLNTGMETGYPNEYGDDYLYIDLKPTYNGNMTYALYSDAVCSEEYEGSEYNVDSVAANMGLLYGSYLEQWNNAMEVFKVCQPCRAYNLQNSGGSRYGSGSSSSYWYSRNKNNGNRRNLAEEAEDKKESSREAQYKRKLANYYNDDGQQANSGWYNADGDDYYYYDPNNGYFMCTDDADYSNVNQCMKFRSHGELEPASFEDLVYATNQRGILQVNVSGIVFGSPFVSKEQNEYLTYVRKQKQAAYEAELQRKAAQAMATAPSGRTMIVIGGLWVAFGVFALLLASVRVLRQWRSYKETRTLTEPLQTSPSGIMT